jgi:molybdopterin synthase catalytic subunit
MAGSQTVTTMEEDKFELVRSTIDAGALVRHVRAGQDGAIVTFDGFVRNESHGRETSYLEYEAYESMALGKMKEIAAQIHE